MYALGQQHGSTSCPTASATTAGVGGWGNMAILCIHVAGSVPEAKMARGGQNACEFQQNIGIFRSTSELTSLCAPVGTDAQRVTGEGIEPPT